MKPTIFYQSTIRGITESKRKLNDVIYWGKVIRIPSADFPENMLKYEIDPMDLLKDDGWGCEYVPDGTIERYEIRELGTGDCLVMYRIPFRAKSKVVLQ